MSEMAILKKLCDAGPTLDFSPLGVCRGMDPVIFFPPKGYDATRQHAEAKRICATCPVRLDCLAWGICHERNGTWGGVGERARRILRGKLRVTLRTPETPLVIDGRFKVVA